jgi:hypothetical protein
MKWAMLGWVTLAGTLLAADVPPEVNAGEVNAGHVTAECKMVILPQKLALPLIDQLTDLSTNEVAWKKVASLVDSGKATLVADMVTNSMSGTRAVAENMQEFMWPDIWRFPELPPNISRKKALDLIKATPIVGLFPLMCGQQNIGTNFQITASINRDGGTCNVELWFSHTRFLHFDETPWARRADGSLVLDRVPDFHTMTNRMTVDVRSGQKLLVGVHKTPGLKSDFLELFLLEVHFSGPADPHPRVSPLKSARVEALIISMPGREALRLMSRLTASGSIAPVVNELKNQIGDGKVELLGWPQFLIKDNERGISQTDDEIRYPSYYEPPSTPGLGWERPRIHTDVMTKLKQSNAGLAQVCGTAGPNVYEGRNFGLAFEMELKNESADAQLSVRLTGPPNYVRTKGVLALNGSQAVHTNVEFDTFSSNEQRSISVGEWALGGTFLDLRRSKFQFWLIKVNRLN